MPSGGKQTIGLFTTRDRKVESETTENKSNWS